MAYTGDSLGLNANAPEFVPLALQQSHESQRYSSRGARPEQDLNGGSLGYTDRAPGLAATSRRPARGHLQSSTSGKCPFSQSSV